MAVREREVYRDDEPVEPPPERRSPAGIIIGIVLAVLIIGVILFFVLGGDVDVDTEGDLEIPETDIDIDPPDIDTTDGGIEVTPGDAEADAGG
jgi:hypothetical protein